MKVLTWESPLKVFEIISDGTKWTYAEASDQVLLACEWTNCLILRLFPHENAASITTKTFDNDRFNVELYRSSRRSQSSGLNVRWPQTKQNLITETA